MVLGCGHLKWRRKLNLTNRQLLMSRIIHFLQWFHRIFNQQRSNRPFWRYLKKYNLWRLHFHIKFWIFHQHICRLMIFRSDICCGQYRLWILYIWLMESTSLNFRYRTKFRDLKVGYRFGGVRNSTTNRLLSKGDRE